MERWPFSFVLLLHALFLGCGSRTGVSISGSDGGPGCVPVAEVCDGADDDCDGRVDEDIAPVECGPTDCRTSVRCAGGVMPECVPRIPAPEACNFEDDDCDGAVDEDLGFGARGDILTLRRDEFDTGSCTSCSWAFGTTLAELDDGLLALFRIGISGGREMANLYGRRLDRGGHPTGPIELLRDDVILDLNPMPAIQPPPDLGVPMEAAYRVGRDDLAGLLFVNAAGGTRSVRPLSPSGPRNRGRMVWTGERFVAAWEQDGGRMASYAADGSDEQAIDVSAIPARLASMTLAVYPGRVGVLVAVVREDDVREQWLVLLDPRGDVTSLERVDLPYRSWQRLVGIEDGWLYIDPGPRTPSTWQILSVEGELRSESREFEDGRWLSDSAEAEFYLPLPSQRRTLFAWSSSRGVPDADLHIEMLDSSGTIVQRWSGPLPDEPDPRWAYFADPHVVQVDDHYVLVWHAGAPDSTPNSVYALEFGCVP